VAGNGKDAGTAGTNSGDSSCLDGITDFGAQGPFEYEAAHDGPVKIWVPKVPAGCKVPIIHLANGTGASCSAYQRVLNSFASHGFLTTCYENPNTGAGTRGVRAIETVMMNHGEMAAKKIGSTGHSQGGQAAFTVLQQAEEKWGDSYTYAGLAMQPASGFGSQPSIPGQRMYAMIKSPMFMFSGTADTLVSRTWVSQAFSALSDSLESYHWSAIGSTHVPPPLADTIQVGVPWFRWKLLGDEAACAAFTALPDGPDWDVVNERNAQPCM
jgi:predicted alpha/beta-hydrolase family hydrolase